MSYLLLASLHLLAALIWVGGMLFLPLVALPVLRREAPGSTMPLAAALGRRFRPVAWACIGVLIVTGLALLPTRGVPPAALLRPGFWASDFGQLLALKLVLASGLVLLAFVHDFLLGPRLGATAGQPDQDRQRLRRRTLLLARITVLLALLTVGVGILMVRGPPG